MYLHLPFYTYRLCSDILEGQCSTGGPVLDTSDCSSFLFKSFEENLLPIILVRSFVIVLSHFMCLV